MSPLPVVASEEQKAAEAAFLQQLQADKRQLLERRLSNGRSREEELSLIEQVNSDVRERLESRLRGAYSKNQAFMSVMFHWYRNLDAKKKQRLTPKQLKRQALGVCRDYYINYPTLPLNWVICMQTQLNMKLYQKKVVPKVGVKKVDKKPAPKKHEPEP